MNQRRRLRVKLLRGCTGSLEHGSRFSEKRRCGAFNIALPMLLLTLELIVKLFFLLGAFRAAEFLQCGRVGSGVKQVDTQFGLSSDQIRYLIQSLPTSGGVVNGHKNFVMFAHGNLHSGSFFWLGL